MMRAVDLFAGLGGFTEGARAAGVRVIWAGNHWQAACDTHARNHPTVTHACQDLAQANFLDVPAHDLLLASPACQGQAWARGKERPHHDAARSTAWAVVTCAEVHRPRLLLVENVPEFMRWSLFPAWHSAMRALGYALSLNIVDAADYGVPQNRRRLIIVGTRSRAPLTLRGRVGEQLAFHAHIDWSSSRWSRVTGLVPATRARIASGRARFGDRFVAPYYGNGSGLTGRSLARPIGTITTRDRWAVVDGDRARVLTVDECRIAMGFPSTYRLPANKKLAKHMLGNAVCPPMVTEIIREVAA